jgi:hypothetical protein
MSRGDLIFLSAHASDREQALALPKAGMHKRFVLVIGVFLGSHVPAAAQTPAPRIVRAQEHVAPTITVLPAASTPSSAASFLLSRDPGNFDAHFSLMFAGAYERDYNLEHLSPMDEVKTLSLTQSSLPLIQLWRGRLQLDAFQSTLHFQNVLVDPFSDTRGSRLPGQSYPGGSRSDHLSGVSLTFRFGRDARSEHRDLAWRRLSRILGAALN